MTTDGFFSAVEHREDHDCVLVRARVRADLERAFPGIEVEAMEKADYPFRVKIGKGAWAAYCARAAATIDYDNFKSRITEAHRHNVYLSVWAALRRLASPAAKWTQPMLWGDPFDQPEADADAVEQLDCDWCGHPFELHYLLDDDPDAGCSACPDKRCTEASAQRCTCTDMRDSYDWTPCPVHPDPDAEPEGFHIRQDIHIHVSDDGFTGG